MDAMVFSTRLAATVNESRDAINQTAKASGYYDNSKPLHEFQNRLGCVIIRHARIIPRRL